MEDNQNETPRATEEVPDTDASQRDALKQALSDAGTPVYAVLDGAKFDALPDMLFDNDFSHKPLYRDMGSELREIEQTTPQFVRFDQWDYWENELTPAERVESLLEAVEDLSAGVFWVYEGDPKTLFKHLRTINNIMIPRDADTPPMPDPMDPDGQTFGNTATHQQVLFRHADANVMAQVLPVLSPQQLTRVLGPAASVIFAPTSEWSLGEDIISIHNPKDTYNPSHPLKLSNPDMAAIDERRELAADYMIKQYVLRKMPEIGNPQSKRFLSMLADAKEAGNQIGFEDPESYRVWAHIICLTKGDILQDGSFLRDLSAYTRPDDSLSTVQEAVEAGDNPMKGLVI